MFVCYTFFKFIVPEIQKNLGFHHTLVNVFEVMIRYLMDVTIMSHQRASFSTLLAISRLSFVRGKSVGVVVDFECCAV